MDKDLEGHIYSGLDVVDLLGFMDKKKKKYLAIGLNELEEICVANGIDLDSEEFKLIRKLILDLVNEYTRSICRLIFGDIEYERYKGNPEQ